MRNKLMKSRASESNLNEMLAVSREVASNLAQQLEATSCSATQQLASSRAAARASEQRLDTLATRFGCASARRRRRLRLKAIERQVVAESVERALSSAVAHVLEEEVASSSAALASAQTSIGEAVLERARVPQLSQPVAGAFAGDSHVAGCLRRELGLEHDEAILTRTCTLISVRASWARACRVGGFAYAGVPLAVSTILDASPQPRARWRRWSCLCCMSCGPAMIGSPSSCSQMHSSGSSCRC